MNGMSGMNGIDTGPWVMLVVLGMYHGINPGMGWLFAVALGLQEQSRKAVLRAFAPIALGHAVSIATVVLLFAALRLVVPITIVRYVGAGLLIAYGIYKLVAPMSHPRWVGMRVGFRDLAVWSFLMATAHGAGLMLVPILLKLPSGQMAAAPPVAAVSTSVAQLSPGAMPPVVSADTPTLEPSMDGMEGMDGMAGIEGHEHMHHADSPDDHSEHGNMAMPVAPNMGEQDMGEHAKHLQAVQGSSPLAALAAVLLHTGAMFLTMALVAVVVYEKVGLRILRRAWFNLDLLWAIALIAAGIVTCLL